MHISIMLLICMLSSCSNPIEKLKGDLKIGQSEASAKSVVARAQHENEKLTITFGKNEIIITDEESYSLEQLVVLIDDLKIKGLYIKDSGTR